MEEVAKIGQLKVQYYTRSDFHKLESIWRSLERGRDMTYFQSYGWYSMVLQSAPKDCWFWETIIVVVLDECTEKVHLIVPLFVQKRRYRILRSPKIIILGEVGWNDYLNAIYVDTSEAIVKYLVNELRTKYPQCKLRLTRLAEDTQFYQFVKNLYPNIVDNTESCVALRLPETCEQYHKLLSKSVRQNIRTAKNRMLREGISLTYIFDDKSVDKNEIWRLRCLRASQKSIEVSTNMKGLLKGRVNKMTAIPWGEYNPYFRRCQNQGHDCSI